MVAAVSPVLDPYNGTTTLTNQGTGEVVVIDKALQERFDGLNKGFFVGALHLFFGSTDQHVRFIQGAWTDLPPETRFCINLGMACAEHLASQLCGTDEAQIKELFPRYYHSGPRKVGTRGDAGSEVAISTAFRDGWPWKMFGSYMRNVTETIPQATRFDTVRMFYGAMQHANVDPSLAGPPVFPLLPLNIGRYAQDRMPYDPMIYLLGLCEDVLDKLDAQYKEMLITAYPRYMPPWIHNAAVDHELTIYRDASEAVKAYGFRDYVPYDPQGAVVLAGMAVLQPSQESMLLFSASVYDMIEAGRWSVPAPGETKHHVSLPAPPIVDPVAPPIVDPPPIIDLPPVVGPVADVDVKYVQATPQPKTDMEMMILKPGEPKTVQVVAGLAVSVGAVWLLSRWAGH
jgi:hypothetical protein